MKKSLCILLLFLVTTAYGQDIIIKGIDKSHKRTNAYVSQEGPFFDPTYAQPVSFRSVYENDSVFTITIKGLKQPTFAAYGFFGTTIWDCVLTPGDRIKMEISGEGRPLSIAFSGKNALNYSYWYDLYQIGSAFNLNQKLKDVRNWQEFKSNLDLYSVKTDSLIREYEKKGMSSFLKNAAVSEKLGHYYMRLAMSYSYSKGWSDPTVPSPLVKSDTLNFKALNQEQLLGLQLYSVGTLNLVKITDGNRWSDQTLKNLTENTNFIQRHFKGKVKDFLLGKIIQDYTKSRQTTIKKEIFLPVLEQSITKIEDIDYKTWAVENQSYYLKANKPFPEEVLRSQLLDMDSTKVLFSEILDRYKGKPLVIDFWANWCGPCKQEFVDGKQQVEKYKAEGYQFLYISIDKPDDYGKMKADAQKYNLTENSYMISNLRKDTPLYTYMQLHGIPRYVLVDKNGILKTLNMPNPSNAEAFKSMLLLYMYR